MSEQLVFNGINGLTGEYLFKPMAPKLLGRIALGRHWDPNDPHLLELKWRYEQRGRRTFALKAGLDPKRLDQAGWGVIFPADASPSAVAAIREALSPLLDLRRQQVGDLYREYTGAVGYRRGEGKNRFLARHKVGPGPVDPARVPYYLLIVGDPESIPYRVQYELDVAYAVGRIHFDTLDEYAQYARSVVEAETSGQVKLPRRAVFFGVANPQDDATNLSAKFLVTPLAEGLAQDQKDKGWRVDLVKPEEATKGRLLELLGRQETPALLFTASHGIGFPSGHTLQARHQGALLCQDWQGPGTAYSPDHYLSADDIEGNARLLGLISFHFACYGGGTPYWDDFAEQAFIERKSIAPNAFVAALPKRLLGHPKGGALAVVGHIERAWTFSFYWDNPEARPESFQSTLNQLMDGYPLGAALEFMNMRYAEIATILSNEVDETQYQANPNLLMLANLWTANKDARGYAVLGDPAIKLPVGDDKQATAERPMIAAVLSRPAHIPSILAPDPELAARRGPTPPSAVSAPGAPDNYAAAVAANTDAAAPAGQAFAPDTGTIADIGSRLGEAFNQLAGQLGAFLRDITSLEVATYTSDRIGEEKYDALRASFGASAQQRALTWIGLDGDMKVCVPTNAGQIDQALWSIHMDLVRQAQANRAEMIKAVGELLLSLLPNLKLR